MKKIAILSQPEYFRLHYLDFLQSLEYDIREFNLKFNAGIEYYSELIEFNPDILICFRGEYIADEVLNTLSAIKIAISSEPFPRKYDNKWNYSPDSINRYTEFRKIRYKKFDYVFHYDKYSKDLFTQDEMYLSGYFNFPISVRLLHYENVEKKWDISFLGRSSDRREDFMLPLKHEYNFLHIAHGVVGEDINYYVNRSKINLNIHASDEKSWEPRLQILMAAKSFVLSEEIPPNDLLVDGVHYVSFKTPDELRDKVKYYLENPDQCEIIASNARKLMKSHFDAVQYFTNLVENISSFPKFKVNDKIDNSKSINNYFSDQIMDKSHKNGSKLVKYLQIVKKKII